MTVSPQIPSEHDQHLLSAYLDGALSSREKAMLEQRLARDPALRVELDHLRDTVALLRDLPRLRAPRDFTLDPQRYARPLPWWKRLFTLEMALQFSGALGAAASLILIVAAVLLTGDSSNDAAKLSDQAQDGQAAPDQSSSQVALQFTATALRRTLTLDDTALAEETAISFAGEEFQSTMAAQSAYYATHQPATATHLPAEAPAPGPMMEADQVESGTFSTESQAEGEVGAAMPSAPLGTEQENTMMQQDEDYAPAEAAGAGGERSAADSAAGAGPPLEPGLAAPPAGFAPTLAGTPTLAAGNAFREGPDDTAATEELQALDNEPAFTQTPLEAAAVVTNTPQSAPAEERGSDENGEAESSPDWPLIVVGAIVLAASALLFGIGRRMARG